MSAPLPKDQGPTSYFPSIEKKCGRPVAEWLALLGTQKGMKHMEWVAFLKTEHQMGHGHAHGLVAHFFGGFQAGLTVSGESLGLLAVPGLVPAGAPLPSVPNRKRVPQSPSIANCKSLR